MSKPHLKVLILVMLTGPILAACSSESPKGVDKNTSAYFHSTDTHPCLGIEVFVPDVIELGTEATVRVDVDNRCNETLVYTSGVTPYTLHVIDGNNKMVQSVPEAHVALPGEFSLPPSGTTSYDVPVMLSAENVSPGIYTVIANLSVDQDTGPDKTQYAGPLRLESEPQSIDVKP